MLRISATIGVLMLAGLAIGAPAWTPTGGSPQSPAPDGTYTGDVEWVSEISGNPPTETDYFVIKTATGELVLSRNDLTDKQEKQLEAASPGNAQAAVTISNGGVTKVRVL
ncbi:MAG: hypothetical protein ACT4PV_06980 [Planctomycetaceae bacterium]